MNETVISEGISLKNTVLQGNHFGAYVGPFLVGMKIVEPLGTGGWDGTGTTLRAIAVVDDGNFMEWDFHCGSAITEYSSADALYAAALDACYAETHNNLDEFMADLGYETINKATRDFAACKKAKEDFEACGIDNVCDWIEETFPQELF